MFWSRSLLPLEQQFIAHIFGNALNPIAPRVRLGLRRVGDTHRALCLNGGWMSFPRACYTGGRLDGALRLEHPTVAGLFAHELLHQLQRHHGLPVTRQALLLHGKDFLLRWRGGCDPYDYQPCSSSRALLRQFWQANVEQQAQIWQDHVQAVVAGQPEPSLALVAQAVRSGRLRRGQV